jgi:hypothetical protein
LLSYLPSGFGFVFRFLLTAPHALAHPVAHDSCVTYLSNNMQANADAMSARLFAARKKAYLSARLRSNF